MGALIASVADLSMVAESNLRRLGEQVWWLAVDEAVPGAFVECGVWHGGASFLMAKVLQAAGIDDRKVWLLDSFQGLSPPSPLDGSRVADRWADPDPDINFKWIEASDDDVRASARRLGVEAMCEIRAGWFDDLLARVAPEIGPIALLRIDCDFYDPVLKCLEILYDQVVDGGMVIFDDYFTYPGCSIAVHEFLGSRRVPWPLVARPENWIAWLRKGQTV
jgi:O-methyltransferase